MSVYRRLARSKKGMSTIFGGLFFVIIILMGFNVMLWGFIQYDAYNHVITSMSQRDQIATSENLVPVNVTCSSTCASGSGTSRIPVARPEIFPLAQLISKSASRSAFPFYPATVTTSPSPRPMDDYSTCTTHGDSRVASSSTMAEAVTSSPMLDPWQYTSTSDPSTILRALRQHLTLLSV